MYLCSVKQNKKTMYYDQFYSADQMEALDAMYRDFLEYELMQEKLNQSEW